MQDGGRAPGIDASRAGEGITALFLCELHAEVAEKGQMIDGRD